MLDRVLRNCDPSKRGSGALWPTDWLFRAIAGASAKQGDYAPLHAGASTLRRGEYMCADRLIDILDGYWDLQDGLKGLAHIKPQRLAANKDRYGLQVARRFARHLGRNQARVFCRTGCFPRGYHRIEFRLELGFGRAQLRVSLSNLRGRFRFGVLSLRP